MSERAGDRERSSEEDFFLPDLCQAQSILFLVVVAELLVLVVVLAPSHLVDFSWADLGLSSLFVQWVVLSSAATLCNIRPLLMRMTAVYATITGYALILSLTLAYSIVAEWVLAQDSWGPEQTGGVGRNLVVATVMTGIAFRYFYLQHQLRQHEKAELNSRIQALQSRIRPHFLFNSMNIIASLIEVDPEAAEQVVEDLSLLFRASLNDSSNLPVLLSEELELCEKYVNIESLRLDERLEVKWQVDVDPEQVRIPLLTLQPLIENAIYHGIQPHPDGGVVTVSIQQVNNRLTIDISNPLPPSRRAYERGKRRLRASASREPREHETPRRRSHERGNRMALDNIRRRLEAIYGMDAQVTTQQDEMKFKTQVSYPLKNYPLNL